MSDPVRNVAVFGGTGMTGAATVSLAAAAGKDARHKDTLKDTYKDTHKVTHGDTHVYRRWRIKR